MLGPARLNYRRRAWGYVCIRYAVCRMPPGPAPTPNLIRLSVIVETNATLSTDVVDGTCVANPFSFYPGELCISRLAWPRPEARPDLVCFPWGVAPAPRQVATTITTTGCHNRLFHGGSKSCWGACQAWVGGIHACRLVSFFVFGDPTATRVRQRQELVVRMGALIQPRTSNEANREGHQRIRARSVSS